MTRSLVFLAVLLAGILHGQQPAAPEDPRSKTLLAIQSQLPVLAQEENSLKDLRAELKKALTAEEKADIELAISERRDRIRDIRDNIRSLASGVPEDEWKEQASTPRSLNEEFQDVLAPAIDQLREATAGPREMSALREEIARWEQRLRLAEDATARLAALPDAGDLTPEVQPHLAAVRELWEERRNEATGELQALRTRLDEKIARNRGLLETISDGFNSFWRGRGFNLLLALAAFVAVFVIGRRFHRFARLHNPIQKVDNTPVYARILDLLAGLVIAICATSAALLVLYVRGDWLLLSLATIVVVAAILTSRNSILPYADQIRTILNLGPVRHGERIVIDQVPWQVDSLGFYCGFSNPAIPGARLRLPIREVIALRSRPIAPKEPWFPCLLDEWIVLSNGHYGKIIRLTPETVVMLHLGGSRKSYTIPDFLALAPENLSKGFRVSSVFGVDYSHQPLATSRIRETLQQGVQLALLEIVAHEHLKNLTVEFMQAAPSSLDFMIMADFTGEVASQRNRLERAIQAACVDLATQHQWRIPFPQLTVHSS